MAAEREVRLRRQTGSINWLTHSASFSVRAIRTRCASIVMWMRFPSHSIALTLSPLSPSSCFHLLHACEWVMPSHVTLPSLMANENGRQGMFIYIHSGGSSFSLHASITILITAIAQFLPDCSWNMNRLPTSQIIAAAFCHSNELQKL